MNVFIVTFGSRGDVQPYVALGKGLKASGHDVTICTAEQFQPFISEQGLNYGYMTGDLLKLIETDAGREAMGKGFNKLVRLLTGLKFHDTQCGFKLLHRARTAPLFELMRVDGFAWDVELLFLAVRFGLGVAEVPVRWINDDRSTVNVLRDPPRMLLDVLRVRWRFRVGAYDPAATTAGRRAG